MHYGNTGLTGLTSWVVWRSIIIGRPLNL